MRRLAEFPSQDGRSVVIEVDDGCGRRRGELDRERHGVDDLAVPLDQSAPGEGLGAGLS